MYFTISKIVIRELSPVDYHLISRDYLISQNLINDPLAHIFAAMWEGEIIGIVTVYNYHPGCCIISKLYVEPMFQGHGIGEVLLDTADRFCRTNSMNVLRCAVDDDSCDVQKISKLFKRLGWRALGIDHNYYRMQIKNISNTFLGKHTVGSVLNAPNVIVKRMSETSEDEYNTLNKYIKEIPHSLRPDIMSNSIIKELSLYLLKDGNVIGWISTTKKEEKEICIENIYVKYEYRNSGYGITLMTALMNIILSDDIQFKYISYFTNDKDASIKRMYNLLFGKYIDEQINHYNFEKRYDV